ncbi:hypothetical protein [Opitutus terrae]|uniref:Lipoprotein n=1 Tax=Opitutus terrae (strain DSM 11246 / JCM 15787 / PB90-1) TaxID=452637 RepID=B1ZR62_OPITP|nr:hypothetical protein [Opitutus terrae]ACB73733.1 hypothetical protein Oter_0443 [Opitutus terrae PB90-1]
MKRGPNNLLPQAVVALAVLAWSGLGFVGCTSPGIHDPARIGPFFTPSNFVGEAQLPAELRRVVLMPVAAGTAAPAESAAALDPVFLTELQKENRFEVVRLTRSDCLRRFRLEELSSTAVLPANFMAVVRQEYAADGVLFVDLTAYKPYRPLAIGVRAKLVLAGPDARVLWAFDNVFSTTDDRVANAARHHFLKTDRSDVPADFTQAVLQSPSRFGTYVAAATFATLPPVYAPSRPAQK